MHGVPGDYNLDLLDYVEPSGLNWVGNANELNAAYAADGYSRIKGLGAIITTFGVGELSAINAIAGAYAELAPVVHIVGIPARDVQDGRLLIHHTFNDGEYRRFADMHARVTSAQACLMDPLTAAQQIDETLIHCLLRSRPVYIQVPMDMVAAIVPGALSRLGSSIQVPEPAPHPAEKEVMDIILDKIKTSKQPIIMVDGESRPLGILDMLDTLIAKSKWATWTTAFGKGLVNEKPSNYRGVYAGAYDEPAVRDFFEGADLAFEFGPHHSLTNSYAYTSMPKAEVTVAFTLKGIKIGSKLYRDVSASRILSQILEAIDFESIGAKATLDTPTRYHLRPIKQSPADGPLTQDRVWNVLGNVLKAGDIVMGETGTSGYGVREMPLPEHVRGFGPVTWLSIGYMLPAAQGAALAQRELAKADKYYGIKEPRTVLFMGDGSFQMTVQELATIIHHDLDVTVFLINNDGYTIERCLHGKKQPYNTVSRWRYIQAPDFFGASEDTYTASCKTWGDLEAVLTNADFQGRRGLKWVEIVLDREDTPLGILRGKMEERTDAEIPKVTKI
jgi:pyruvate decarboxylase